MASWFRKIYSPRAFDGAFAIAAAFGCWGLVELAGIPYPAIAASANPLMKGAALLGIALGASLLAGGALRVDQKWADDYTYLTLATSSYLGMYTFLFSAVLWHVLLEQQLGTLPMPAVICLWMVSWPLGWATVRLRGTRVQP